ncbi:M16 family metallopeptidase [Hugenholtzia roseola]|uniref:M16 family metallopeptidase n=1 Tax=Hugenholtzia roseola TaxID=1002 RepID=UPI0003FEB222|nr:pitrilysin family protein [Hugenholtzia roseola]
MLDRTQAPAAQPLAHFTLPTAHSFSLANQLKVRYKSHQAQPAIQLLLVFEAGRTRAYQRGQAELYVQLLMEGTQKMSAEAFAQALADLGTYLDVNASDTQVIFSLTTLKKFLQPSLELLLQLIEVPLLEEETLLMLKNIQIQNLKVQQEKTAFVANRIYRKTIFGQDSPFAQFAEIEDVEKITTQDLKQYHQAYIAGKPFSIFMAGDIEQNELEIVNQYLGHLKVENQDIEPPSIENYENSESSRFYFKKKEALQTSIRIGRRCIDKTHPDYVALRILIGLLGGYFGSRLMQNLREEKGLTYGVHAQINNIRGNTFFTIQTDVKKEQQEQAVSEIYKEIERLKQEKVPITELDLFRNYLIGSFLGVLATPFQIMQQIKVLYDENLPLDYYDNFIQKIKSTTPDELQKVAQEHLVALQEVLVG